MRPSVRPSILLNMDISATSKSNLDQIWAATSENRTSGFPTRSDTNRAWQSLKIARDLKFRIKEVEGLYYPWSENKDADQVRGYREADLRLCFRICKKSVFSRRGSFYMRHHLVGGKAWIGFGPSLIRTVVSLATDSSHRVIMEKMVLQLFLCCFCFHPIFCR